MSEIKTPLPKPLEGFCLCGQVSLKITQIDRQILACHCQQCRKQTGSFVHAAGIKDSHLDIKGEEHLTWFAASNQAKRGFCRHCGSLLFWKLNGSENTSVMTGCLESPTGLELVGHIFVEDKGDYYSIDDNVEQFPQTGGHQQ